MTDLSCGPVTLRRPNADDVASRLALGNRPDIHRMFGGDPADFRELTQDGAEAWVARLTAEKHGWVITFEGRLVGSIRLHSINPMDRRASLAIGILDPNALGQGIGTRAMRLVARHAFETLGLNRLSLRVLDFNARAIAAYEKVGFKLEGREREAAIIAGQWHDDLLMGLLAREFLADDPGSEAVGA